MVLGQIGNGLFQHQRVQVTLSATAQSSARTAAVGRREAQRQYEEQDGQQSGQPAGATLRMRNVAHILRFGSRGAAAGAGAGTVAFGV